MRPERESRLILAAIQARAKMHEYRAAEEDYVPFRRAPETLFPLAVGILHDAAGAISGRFVYGEEGPVVPAAWEEDDGSIELMVRFSASFFDAFLEAQLKAEITTEFSLLCAVSYYLCDSVGIRPWAGTCGLAHPLGRCGPHRRRIAAYAVWKSASECLDTPLQPSGGC